MQFTRKPVKFPHLTRIPLRSSVFGSSAPRPQGGGAAAGRGAGKSYKKIIQKSVAGIATIYTPSALSSLVAVPLHTPSFVPCSAPLFPPSLRSVGYRGLHCVSLSVMWACTALAVVSALCRYRDGQF